MGAARRFSTEDIAHHDRLGFWNAGAVAIGGVEADRLDDHVFQGTVVRRALGDAKVFRLDTSPHRAAWTRRLIALGEGDPHLRIWFQHRGSTIVSTRHGEHIVRAGEWSVSDGRYPYVATHLEASRKLALQLPFSRLARHEQDAIARLPGALQFGSGIARMLQACLHGAIAATAETDDRLDADLGETMIDFVRMLLHEQRLGSDVAPIRELTQDRIRAFVRRNVGNPALSVEMIAQAMKCSKRYVHKVFNGDETISEHIWATRLESCRAALASSRSAQTTLTQIAFENGFSSSAHFSRAFREKFGTAPKAYRAQMLDASSRTDKMRMSGAASEDA